MGAELQMTSLSVDTSQERHSLPNFADTGLKAAAGFWFLIAVIGQWSGRRFFRVEVMLSFLIFKGPFGFDPATFQGPLLTFLAFAQFLLPLSVLELYLRTKDRASAPRRIAMAAGLFVLTLAMNSGSFAATMGMWLPRVKKAYDHRKSMADTLSATIASSGIDQAVQQCHDLKAAEPATYKFDEDELNTLGYELIHANKFKEAIRILQLNVAAYP